MLSARLWRSDTSAITFLKSPSKVTCCMSCSVWRSQLLSSIITFHNNNRAFFGIDYVILCVIDAKYSDKQHRYKEILTIEYLSTSTKDLLIVSGICLMDFSSWWRGLREGEAPTKLLVVRSYKYGLSWKKGLIKLSGGPKLCHI